MVTNRKPDRVDISKLRYGSVSAYLSAIIAAQEFFGDDVAHLHVMRGIHCEIFISKTLEGLENIVDFYQVWKTQQDQQLVDGCIPEGINFVLEDGNASEEQGPHGEREGGRERKEDRGKVK